MEARITQLVASKRKPERINIFVEGEFALQVHIDVIANHRLAKGVLWTAELETSLRGAKRDMKVRTLAYAYATYKPRSIQQVRTHLQRKEFAEAEIEEALQFLAEFGYVDDEKFTRMFVRDRLLRGTISERKIVMDLRKRGIAPELAERITASLYPQEERVEVARKAAAKKMKSLRSRPVEKQRKALSDYLQRQGFSWSLIKPIVQEFVQAPDSRIDDADDEG